MNCTIPLYHCFRIAIAVTVERLVAIRRPLHARLFWNSRRITLILVGIYVISFYLVLHNWFWMWPVELRRCDGGKLFGLQQLKKDDSPIMYWYVRVSQYIAVFFTIAGPVIALMVLNSWLVYSLRQNRREMTAKFSITNDSTQPRTRILLKKRAFSTGPANSSPNLRQRTSESKVAFMVFVISASFILFELPSAILFIWDTAAFFTPRKGRPQWFSQAAAFSNQLVSVNKALNFAVYCGAGQHFRRVFLRLVCKRLPFKRFYRYGSTHNQTSGYNFPATRTVSVCASPCRSGQSHRTVSSASHVHYHQNSPNKLSRDMTVAKRGGTAI